MGIQFDHTKPGHTQRMLQGLLLKEGEVFSSRLPTLDDITYLEVKLHSQFRLNLIDSKRPINPLSYSVFQNLTYVFTGADSSHLGNQVLENVFKDFEYKFIDCKCSKGGVINCTCVVGTNPLCPKFGETDGAPAVNINDSPYFIENVSASFWGCFEPECTISSESKEEGDEEAKKVVYKIVHCNEYQLNQLEQTFFMKHRHCNDPTRSQEPSHQTLTKVVISGCCVATILSDATTAATTKNASCVLYLHMDYILTACYKVPDIRLLYHHAKDGDVFHSKLLAEIVSFLITRYSK